MPRLCRVFGRGSRVRLIAFQVGLPLSASAIYLAERKVSLELEQGESSEADPCYVSNWAEWGDCSVSCGSGVHSRSRTIVGTTQDGCPALTETAVCDLALCVVNCKVTPWGPWSLCDSECEKERKRTIEVTPGPGGSQCPELSEKEKCEQKDCTSNCQVSHWSSWGLCSTTCGTSVRTRVRDVLAQPGGSGAACPDLVESEDCSVPSCNPSGSVAAATLRAAVDEEIEPGVIFALSLAIAAVFIGIILYLCPTNPLKKEPVPATNAVMQRPRPDPPQEDPPQPRRDHRTVRDSAGSGRGFFDSYQAKVNRDHNNQGQRVPPPAGSRVVDTPGSGRGWEDSFHHERRERISKAQEDQMIKRVSDKQRSSGQSQTQAGGGVFTSSRARGGEGEAAEDPTAPLLEEGGEDIDVPTEETKSASKQRSSTVSMAANTTSARASKIDDRPRRSSRSSTSHHGDGSGHSPERPSSSSNRLSGHFRSSRKSASRGPPPGVPPSSQAQDVEAALTLLGDILRRSTPTTSAQQQDRRRSSRSPTSGDQRASTTRSSQRKSSSAESPSTSRKSRSSRTGDEPRVSSSRTRGSAFVEAEQVDDQQYGERSRDEESQSGSSSGYSSSLRQSGRGDVVERKSAHAKNDALESEHSGFEDLQRKRASTKRSSDHREGNHNAELGQESPRHDAGHHQKSHHEGDEHRRESHSSSGGPILYYGETADDGAGGTPDLETTVEQLVVGPDEETSFQSDDPEHYDDVEDECEKEGHDDHEDGRGRGGPSTETNVVEGEADSTSSWSPQPNRGILMGSGSRRGDKRVSFAHPEREERVLRIPIEGDERSTEERSADEQSSTRVASFLSGFLA
ncbi:unnamed protein product [Amoebophrya sp. A25]|nr:unnamed protein product [Amoebophrya sp. A25]|eukprot:GSA25T00005283001.1